MNDDLKKKLEAQRKWRTPEPARVQPTKQRTGWSFTQKLLAFMVGLPLVVLIAFYAWVLAAFPSIEDTSVSSPAPATESAVTVTENVTSIEEQQTIPMTACTGGDTNGKLHVRIEPGLQGEVRGYLTEGETVIVPLGEQNEPITKIVDDISWMFIQSPITGWVSASHLCK